MQSSFSSSGSRGFSKPTPSRSSPRIQPQPLRKIRALGIDFSFPKLLIRKTYANSLKMNPNTRKRGFFPVSRVSEHRIKVCYPTLNHASSLSSLSMPSTHTHQTPVSPLRPAPRPGLLGCGRDLPKPQEVIAAEREYEAVFDQCRTGTLSLAEATTKRFRDKSAHK